VIIGPPSATYTAPPGTTYSTPSPYSSPSGPPAANSPGTTFSNQPAAGATNGSTTNGSATPGAAGAGSAATGNPSGGGNPSGSGAPESRLRLRVIPDIAPPPSGFKPEAAPGANGPAGVGNPAGSPDDTSPKSKDSGVEGQKTNLQPPRLMDPQDRVTARPIRQTLVYKPVSADPVLQAGASETAPLDDSGWRAAK